MSASNIAYERSTLMNSEKYIGLDTIFPEPDLWPASLIGDSGIANGMVRRLYTCRTGYKR